MTDLFNRDDIVSVPDASCERVERIAAALCEAGSVHRVIWKDMAEPVQEYWRKLAHAVIKADAVNE